MAGFGRVGGSSTEGGQPGASAIDLLLPRPKFVMPAEGTCRLSVPAAFNLPRDGSLSEQTVRLGLRGTISLAREPCAEPPEQGLQLLVADPGAGSDSPEAYRLRVEQDRILLSGKTGAGVLNGLRTLAQLALEGRIPCCEIVDWPDMSLRGSHLCYHLIRESLAYNTPNFEALLEHIDRLASVKINAVLLELESMFPYRRHPLLSCRMAFTPGQIEQLRDRLKAQHMEIIPIVQCLGHAYNVLTHDEYARYRELPDHIQQYCPTNPQVAGLYMEFVAEYLEAFPGIKQWHLGGDESRMLGRCRRCKAKMKKLGVSRLYVDHVGEIARRVAAKGLTPLLWSDMLEHHPEALGLLPKNLKIVYWNYSLPTWPRPYAAPMFMEKGFKVIGAPGVRFGSAGTELSIYYLEALAGLESLIPRMHRDGCREMITTSWMKGSPHESADYGLIYGAALCWNKSMGRAEFQNRYARLTFGLADPRICLLYETLSFWLPYAEPVQRHMPDRLDRFDLSGLRFEAKWKRYTSPGEEPAVVEQLRAGLAAADETLKVLDELRSGCSRGKRQFTILELSAQSIQAKARLGLALHEGRRLERAENTDGETLRFCAHLPAIVGAWRAAKERHHRILTETGFPPCIDFLSELMFEPAEADFLAQMGERLAGRIAAAKKPLEVTIAFLDNPGPPYRRGFVHGETFRTEIAEGVERWCRRMIDSASESRLAAKNEMFSYVVQRFPYVIQELQGIADGSHKTLDEIFWLNIFNAVDKVQPADRCSTVIRQGADGALHLAKTSDIDADQRRMALLRRVRDKGRDFYVIGWVGTVWVEAALTRTGLAIGANSGPPQPGQTGQGIGQHFGAYPVLFEADNVEQAVAAFTRITFAGKGQIYGLADAAGNAVILEKTGTAQEVIPRDPEQPGILGVNDYQTESMREYNSGRSQEVLLNCQMRRERFDEWLVATAPGDALAALRELFSNQPFCQTGQAGFHTEWAAIVSPASRELRVSGLPPSFGIYIPWRFSE